MSFYSRRIMIKGYCILIILTLTLLVFSPFQLHAAKAKKAEKKTTPEITETVAVPVLFNEKTSY